jgi:hypothetical protein
MTKRQRLKLLTSEDLLLLLDLETKLGIPLRLSARDQLIMATFLTSLNKFPL